MGSAVQKGGQHVAGEKKSLDVESRAVSEQRVMDDEAYPAPTPEERTTLRKVNDAIPLTAWLLCFVEVGERAS